MLCSSGSRGFTGHHLAPASLRSVDHFHVIHGFVRLESGCPQLYPGFLSKNNLFQYDMTLDPNRKTTFNAEDAILDPRTVIGHVHLKVSDLERSIKFYTEILGFEITTRYGRQAAFLSAGGYHHHIGLNTWHSAGASPPPRNSTGLYHFAILVPSRKDLARSLKRLLDHNWPIEGASDHGVSHAIYLSDPDMNGIEIYSDLPREEWPRDSEGNTVMQTLPLDLNALLTEADHS